MNIYAIHIYVCVHVIPLSHPFFLILLPSLHASICAVCKIYMCQCCLYVMSDLTPLTMTSCAAGDGNKDLVLVNVPNWGGRVTRSPLDPLKLPVDRVIIAHTVTDSCDTLVSRDGHPRNIEKP